MQNLSPHKLRHFLLTWLKKQGIYHFDRCYIYAWRPFLFRVRSAKEGKKAPDFSLNGMDGRKYRMSDYKDQVVVVNFWGTFCPPCRREMLAIESQYKQWKDQGLVIFGVNLGEAEATVKGFVRQYKLTFPILYDPGMSIREKYWVTQYPTTFFIKNGIIRKIHIGEMQEIFLESTNCVTHEMIGFILSVAARCDEFVWEKNQFMGWFI